VAGRPPILRAFDDPVLRWYGALLAACHVLTAVAWFTYKHVATLVTGEDRVCWPLWPGCEGARALLTPSSAKGLVVLYAALGVVATALFLLRRTTPAVIALAAGSVLGAAIYALDYRLRMNQTYMLAWVVVVFLLAPRKHEVLQALVALFYAWAGTLKLHREWVSGAALYAQPLGVPRALTSEACIYVLVLELALVWGLFASSPRWRVTVYAQLVLFHVVSWTVVGYFYPLLMLAVTAIYPLVWALEPGRALTWGRLRREPELARPVGAIVAAFSAVQLVPRAFPGDTAVTGEGRIFALHMFDARVECEGGAVLRVGGRPTARVPIISQGSDARTQCDPIVIAAQASRLCTLVAARKPVPAVDVTVDAKRSTDDAMQPLIHVQDFCAAGIVYSPWRHNAWIGAPSGR
jgi:hypothetical protein